MGVLVKGAMLILLFMSLSILYCIDINLNMQRYSCTVVVPSNESFVLNIDFKILNFNSFKPSLEVYLSNKTVIRLYLSRYSINLMPGFYLFNASGKVIKKYVMLTPNTWYRLVLNYTHSRLAIYLVVLNASYIATDIHYVLMFNQGLAFDGKYWFFTETAMICKLSKNMSKIIRCNFDPIPKFLKTEKYFHLGDLDHYNNVLVIPIERKGFTKPAVIAVYNSTTLKLIKYSYTPQDHMPWISLDSRGYIYTSEYSPVARIHVYHINQVGFGNYIKPVRIIKLSKILEKIQGGAVIDNRLLVLTSDDGDHLYFVDLNTGNIVNSVPLPGPYEIEGVEYFKTNNGTFICILFNIQGSSKNILYCYQYIDSRGRLKLFNISYNLSKIIKIFYDNNTIQLKSKSIELLTKEDFLKFYYSYILLIPIVMILLITILINYFKKK